MHLSFSSGHNRRAAGELQKPTPRIRALALLARLSPTSQMECWQARFTRPLSRDCC
jgi:hypothetical protein